MRYRFGFLWMSLFNLAVYASSFGPQLINGKRVSVGTLDEVVPLRGVGPCTATIVGPRVILTAAHCVYDTEEAEFTYKGKQYIGVFTRSGAYSTHDHDIALGVVKKPIPGARPLTIGGKAAEGASITLFGFGCTKTDFKGRDGFLRTGESEIAEVKKLRLGADVPEGALLCPGDSGGPGLLEGNKRKLIGVNSSVSVGKNLEIAGPSWLIRTDNSESRVFFKEFAIQHRAHICGITKHCP